MSDPFTTQTPPNHPTSNYVLSSGQPSSTVYNDDSPTMLRVQPLTNGAKLAGKLAAVDLKLLQLEKRIQALEDENEMLQCELSTLPSTIQGDIERRVSRAEISMILNLQMLEGNLRTKRKRGDNDEEGEGDSDEETMVLKQEITSMELSNGATHDNSLLELIRSAF
ncbi:hypothetical protein BDZ94DRAFT_475957 [Collybia nuda]|uniref:Uncharacterized protein n=1 Tax=Collybia nuda TaxID=64659 RepID=A0A9P5Y6Q2_9AGAR|nr:hypothetical protein BDZ94DRAFT_475957 [Collybia nuda]